ncbi:MAG: grasp-with-spasm system SPASM domain peptide maturase [Bacteroidales bacterium]|jgi:SPASM domain peptide maturase of grasp-with-spasm system|nr:grasp-with-spasm system SPASM domain peptide maturase [Bacteroidales bacterium]
MKKNNMYFKLYSDNVIIKGAKNYLIYDLTLSRIKEIPELLFFVIKECEIMTYEQVKIKNKDIKKGIDTYINHLINDNWGTFVSDVAAFPEINFEYLRPSKISHAIIELNFNETHKKTHQKAIFELMNFNCNHIQFIISDKKKSEYFDFINKIIYKSNFTSVIIKSQFDGNEYDEQKIRCYLQNNKRIKKIFFFDADVEKTIIISEPFTSKLILTKQPMNTCSVKQPVYILNRLFFYESLHKNNCLNGKICIDKNGNVKNCLYIDEIFGNIKKNSIKSIIDNTKFCNLWDLSKDKIEICKDCEFRYMCFDCRFLLSDKANTISKPLFCNYNPYE